MTSEQKQELIKRIEDEHGVHKLFKDLGLEQVHSKNGYVYCVCPFHLGADNPEGFAYGNGFGYCFTNCHRKFNLFDIVMQVKGYDFMSSVNYLAELVGMEIDSNYSTRLTSDSSHNREFLNQIRNMKSKRITKSWKPIEDKVFNDIEPVMHSMLRKEGFDESVRDYFNLGFAVSGYLSNRITIPIDYIDGNIVTISGRSVMSNEELEETKTRRYLIWFNTEKAVTLYNISRALPHIKENGEVIVVEGFKSVWRLYQWGIYNVVAVMGSSLSDEQRKLLLKLNCRIVVCGDRDEAGQTLNNQVKEECKRYSDVDIMSMYLIDVPEKSSIDNITRQQYDYLYNNKI